MSINLDNLTGIRLGQIGIKRLIGQGGMSDVYEGYQTHLNRPVAVKVLKAALANQDLYLDRFKDEAEIAAQLEQPNIARIYDHGTQDGRYFIVMQLLTGGSLWEKMRPHLADSTPVMRLAEVVALLKQLGDALDHAHSKGVIHRDIKPSNIMFDQDGKAYLVDFGIALFQNRAMRSRKHGTDEALMGTFAYIAPEAWRSEPLTGAADQYALGLIAYSLLTGRAPYEAAPNEETRMRNAHLFDHPTAAHLVCQDLKEVVSRTISRAISKRPEHRFRTVRGFADALDGALRGLDLTADPVVGGGTTQRFPNLAGSRAIRRPESGPRPPVEAFTPVTGEPLETRLTTPEALDLLTHDYGPRRRPAHIENRLFVCFRPEDCGPTAEVVCDRLKRHFGHKAVFTKAPGLQLGANIKALTKAMLKPGTLTLALIGASWASAADQHGRRIDHPNDLLRISLEAALEAGGPLIPLLVDGAVFPALQDIPVTLHALAVWHGMDIRPEALDADIRHLIAQLDVLLGNSDLGSS